MSDAYLYAFNELPYIYNNIESIIIMWKTIEEIVGHSHLVELCPEFEENTLFVTVSPDPKANVEKVKYGRKIIKAHYGNLSKEEQYNYLVTYIQSIYNWGTIDKGFCVFELNESEQLHCHLLIQFKHKVTKYDLAMLRDHVCRNIRTYPHLTRAGRDYMNNIVPITDSISARIKYLEKDLYESTKYFNCLYF